MRKSAIQILLVLMLCMFFVTGCTKESSSDFLIDLDSESDSQNTSEQVNEQDVVGVDDVSSVFVYVVGAVKNAGVYELSKSARVFEAVDMAGGTTETAAVAYLNLARIVEDGERIYIPTLEEVLAEEIPFPSEEFVARQDSGANDTSGKVNINKATLEELMTLSGIGAAKAQNIMDYREAFGSFSNVEDLQNVSGIGAATFQKIQDNICV
ncbi:MAG: helix-hairpin-helix domain-containing protein [Lachnospiraceae bacterium]|nr:helix-hairpin-helix domain-containing protein [Lachnospiraceae bacterium]